MTGTFVGDVQVHWANHATVKLEGSSVVYIDPFSDAMIGEYPQADLIIVTHSHYDHFDPEAVRRLAMDSSVLIAKEGCDISGFDFEVRLMGPGDVQKVEGIKVTGVEAYNEKRFRNPGEPFHPRGDCMGVVVEMDGKKFYHASDTDLIDEMNGLEKMDLDVAFLPIGGTYTMDVDEAVLAVERISPDTVIPIHYNMIEGTEADAQRFKRRVENRTSVEVRILEPDG